MATNDYSSRSKKDVFSDSDNNDAPQSGQNVCATTSGIDIDGIIEKNRTNMIVLKVIVILFSIAILFFVGMYVTDIAPKIWGKIIVIIVFVLPALTLSLMCGDFFYKLFIKIVVKQIDAIKYYRMRRRKPKALKKVLTFDVPIYSSRNENVTKIEIGDTTVTASHFCYTQKVGGYRYGKTITICQGDCYAVDKKNKLIPNGIWLVKNGHKYIKKGIYSRKSKGFMIYADTADAIKNCYTSDICDIAEKIYKAVRTRFALYFENNIMYYIDFKFDDESFEMKVFDFNIENYLRRDLAILNDRIEFSKILASA